MLGSDEIDIDRNDLLDFFIHHLNKVYAAKKLLVSELSDVMDNAHFEDLREAMLNTIEGVINQISRMEQIYEILFTPFSDVSSNGLKALVADSFEDIKHYADKPELRDMSILFYLHNIESLEMASFQILEMASVKLKNDRVKRLLKENYDEAKADRTLLLLINAKYISSV